MDEEIYREVKIINFLHEEKRKNAFNQVSKLLNNEKVEKEELLLEIDSIMEVIQLYQRKLKHLYTSHKSNEELNSITLEDQIKQKSQEIRELKEEKKRIKKVNVHKQKFNRLAKMIKQEHEKESELFHKLEECERNNEKMQRELNTLKQRETIRIQKFNTFKNSYQALLQEVRDRSNC